MTEDIATPREPADEVARYYDAYWNADDEPYYEPDPVLANLILEQVDDQTDVLDVGCGTARSYAPKLNARARSYVGVDVSQAAVKAAKKGGLDARVIESAARLPFADESFDHVVCIEVLEHLFAPDAAAAEIFRVLRPGGRLVVSVPNIAYWRLRVSMLRGTFNPLGDEMAVERPWRDPHLRFFTPTTLRRMLELVGFSHIEVSAHGGRGLDHAIPRPTSFGQGRLYQLAEKRYPSLLGMAAHAAAVK
jgi:methionine biosynthesis protein MetW